MDWIYRPRATRIADLWMHRCVVLVRPMIYWHIMPVTYQIDMHITPIHSLSLVFSMHLLNIKSSIQRVTLIHSRRQRVSGWRFYVDTLTSRFDGAYTWCVQLLFVTVANNDWKKFRNFEHGVCNFAEATEIQCRQMCEGAHDYVNVQHWIVHIRCSGGAGVHASA